MKKGRQTVDARRAKVLSLIRERQKIKVEELAAYFNVSLMTIRRDLQVLEDKGLVGRFYGGATVDSRGASVSEKDTVALYRRLISRYAAALVADGDELFINGSMTALNLLDYVGEKAVADMDKTTKLWNGVADNTLLNRRKVSFLRRDCLTLTCVLTNAPKYDNLTQVSKTPKEGPV